jgi:hypothetical protein
VSGPPCSPFRSFLARALSLSHLTSSLSSLSSLSTSHPVLASSDALSDRCPDHALFPLCVFVCVSPVFSPESCCAPAESAWVVSISQSISDHPGRLGKTRHVSRPSIILSQNTTLLEKPHHNDRFRPLVFLFFVCVLTKQASFFFPFFPFLFSFGRSVATKDHAVNIAIPVISWRSNIQVRHYATVRALNDNHNSSNMFLDIHLP